MHYSFLLYEAVKKYLLDRAISYVLTKYCNGCSSISTAHSDHIEGCLRPYHQIPNEIYEEAMKSVTMYEIDQLAERLYSYYAINPRTLPTVGYAVRDSFVKDFFDIEDHVIEHFKAVCLSLHRQDINQLLTHTPLESNV